MVSARTIHIAGLDSAYHRAGSGPPLVLVHSGASDAREWSNLERPQKFNAAIRAFYARRA